MEANAVQKPSFWFMVDRIRAHGKPRGWSGVWAPPRRLGGSQRLSGYTTNKLYFYDGLTQGVIEMGPNVTPQSLNLALYGEASVYFDRSRFWTVPYDAVSNMVGDGTEGDQDAGGSQGSDADDDTTEDWVNIGFNYELARTGLATSYVGGREPEEKLQCMRANQRWPYELLPRDFHDGLIPTDNPAYALLATSGGGLVGELPVVIALIAFSRPENEVHDALIETMRGPQWIPHVRDNRIGSGWVDKRGMHVRVWSGTYPGTRLTADPGSIEQLELGVYGKLFD